jgi:hypothetical protein
MLNSPHPYRRALIVPAAIQVVLFIFTCITADRGEAAAADIFAAVPFWAGAILIVRKRPHGSTRGNILYLRYGLPVLFIVGLVISLTIRSSR